MSDLTEPVGVIDVRRRKRAFALTEYERLYLCRLLTVAKEKAERRRDESKARAALRPALAHDSEARQAGLLLEILQ